MTNDEEAQGREVLSQNRHKAEYMTSREHEMSQSIHRFPGDSYTGHPIARLWRIPYIDNINPREVLR